MKVKTFHAVTMQDAIRAIKEELGPEAIILSSKEVYQGGRILRLFNRPVLEVMAASEQDVLPAACPPHGEAMKLGPKPQPVESRTSEDRASQRIVPNGVLGMQSLKEEKPSPIAAHKFQATLQSILKPTQSNPKLLVGEKAPPSQRMRAVSLRQERLRHLRGELRELSRLVGAALPPEAQTSRTEASPELARMCRSFVQQGMRPTTADSLVWDLSEKLGRILSCREEAINDALRQEVVERIRVSGPLLAGDGDRVVALMLGPSGSGKTSVITKLAAHYRLEEKKPVAIISFDTYREASIEQIRMYAGVLGVPFASALSPRQLHEGLRRHSQADLILIDMPGVGEDEVSSAKELHRLLREESKVVTQLVLPASMREQDLSRIVAQVKDLPMLRLLFSKLDETDSFGTIFEIGYQTGLPLSYWSVGQRVPEDIELVSQERLATLLAAQRYVAPHMPLSRPPAPQPSCSTPIPVSALPE